MMECLIIRPFTFLIIKMKSKVDIKQFQFGAVQFLSSNQDLYLDGKISLSKVMGETLRQGIVS